VRSRNHPAAIDLLGEPLLGQLFSSVCARAALILAAWATHGIAQRPVRHVSKRELENGGEVVLLTDVTESHLMQVFLTRQQRLLTLGELAAGLAHQIRTPWRPHCCTPRK